MITRLMRREPQVGSLNNRHNVEGTRDYSTNKRNFFS
jgi:hypothetical protein